VLYPLFVITNRTSTWTKKEYALADRGGGAGLWGFLSLIGLVATLVLPLWVEEIDSASTSIFAAGSLLNLSFAIVLEPRC
jgi:hypothetical protein